MNSEKMVPKHNSEVTKHKEKNAQVEMREMPVEIFERLTKVIEFCGEGHEGVVFKIDFNLIDEKTKEELASFFGEELGDQAVKFLKIHKLGLMKGKAEHQVRALKTIEEYKEKNPDSAEMCAEIPDVTGIYQLCLSQEDTAIQKYLEEKNVFAGPDEPLELIIMDYIEGEDFYTHILRELSKRHPTLQAASFNQEFECKTATFGQLKEFIQKELDLLLPDTPLLKYPGTRNKLLRFMKDANVILNPGIFRSLKKTTAVLHAGTEKDKGIVHNDLHEGNLIVKPDGSIGIIDFARAHDVPVTGGVPDDDLLVWDVGSQREKAEQKARKELNAIIEVYKRFSLAEVVFNQSRGKYTYVESREKLLKKIFFQEAIASIHGIVEQFSDKEQDHQGAVFQKLHEILLLCGNSVAPLGGRTYDYVLGSLYFFLYNRNKELADKYREYHKIAVGKDGTRRQHYNFWSQVSAIFDKYPEMTGDHVNELVAFLQDASASLEEGEHKQTIRFTQNHAEQLKKQFKR